MKEPEPDHRMAGRMAMVALIVAFAIAGMMVWIA